MAKYTLLTDEYVAKLKAAFETVQNRENWKLPIDKHICDITQEERDLLHEAIVYFTGSVPIFTKVTDKYGGVWHVVAKGYYATIGA